MVMVAILLKKSNHFLDLKNADIISNVVHNIKSNNLVKSTRSKKNSRAQFCLYQNVNENRKTILHTKCQLWSYATCNGISKSEYAKLMEEDDKLPWYCISCLI